MDSYNFHFERMSTLDLHPLSLPVSRLSPAKSSSSIVDQFAHHHHQHGKGDSAYSSFSGGSTAPDYPSPFLPDDLQPGGALHQYADLKYVKAVYHPGHVLQSDARSMDQLYRSMEAISQQYRYNNGNNAGGRCHGVNGSHGGDKAFSNRDVPLVTPSPPPPPPPPPPSLHPPPPPARLDSFITTRNLENSRVHHQGVESQPQPQQPQQQQQQQPQQQQQQHSRPQPQNAPRPEMAQSESGGDALRSDPVRGGRRSSPLQQPPIYRPHLQQQPHDHSRESLNPEHRSFADNKAACERPEQKSADASNRSPPRAASQPEQRAHGQPAGSSGGWNRNHGNKSHPVEGQRKRAHSAHDILDPELNRPPSPWNAAQHLTNSSIQHKGQFYFVTGVCKPAETGSQAHSVSSSVSESGSESSTMVETYRLRERERCHSTLDNMFKPLQQRPPGSNDSTTNETDVFCSVTHGPELIPAGHDENRIAVSHRPSVASKQCSRSFDALEQNHLNRDIGRHTANHPIFYCGPEENAPALQIVQPTMEVSFSANQPSHHKREEQTKKGRRQPLLDIASERINKETTPMLYHLTGASRVAAKPKKDVNFSVKGKGSSVNKTVHKEPAASCNERAAVAEMAKDDRGGDVSASCNTLDDSFKKYYKEKLKVAQSKVLRETSFKRRDLQLSWPHRIRQRPELRPAVIHSFASSQDSEASTDTLTPSVASEDTERASVKEEAPEKEKEGRKESEKENGKPPKVAQPQVARIGGRKRLTMEQKKMCYSEPEKLHQLGDVPYHSACRSLGNEFEMPFSVDLEREEPVLQGEQGLVATRRKMFETRGRALSASSVSKNSLKHLQHKALVEYMERKTNQKVAEPQQPGPQVLTTPSRQRHSLGEKPSDWGPRPLSGGTETKGPKKKLNRPHSAGRILDAPSSSMRYAQFFSSQSGSVQSGGHPRQAGWRESQGPRQGKCASAESLLDQPEPPSCFRNRSTSTPHAFQAQGIERDPSSVNTTESCSLPIKADEEEEEPTATRPAPEGQQRVRVVAERGKSMEELGTVRVITRPSALSKSSEQLDQLKNHHHQTPLGLEERAKRSTLFFGEVPREAARGQRRERKDPWGWEKEGRESVGQNKAQGQVQTSPTQKKSPLKQDSTPPPPLGGEECTTSPPSPRSASPVSFLSVSSSRPRVHSGSPGSQGSVSGGGGESRLSRPSSSETSSNNPPPSPRGQEASKREVKSTSSSSSPSTTSHTKVPSEKRRSSSRVRTSPPASSSEREQSVDEPTRPSDEFLPPPESKQEVSLSCGVTTDPSLWILPPEQEGKEDARQSPPLTDDVFVDDTASSGPPVQPGEPLASPSTSASDADSSQGAEEEKEEAKAGEGQATEERGAPEGETEEGPEKAGELRPRWAELAEAVVRADQSLARALYPLTNRKTALMLMEQLLSEDTLLMEEHYKKKQEHRGGAESSEPVENGGAAPCSPAPDSQTPQCPEPQDKAEILEKKHLLVSYIEERFQGLEETRGALQTEVRENEARGEAVEALVRERCLPVELERYALFIGDLERVVSLLLCLSARLARVQNALSTVDQNTDAEEKESLDNRHRLLCKQRDDAKDLKDNLDRRESVVSGFLSRQLSADQLRDYRRFVQTKASLLIRQKDLEERQRLGEEQLEALRSTLPL